MPKPIIGFIAALGLPTRRRAFSDETAGSTEIACFRANHETPRMAIASGVNGGASVTKT